MGSERAGESGIESTCVGPSPIGTAVTPVSSRTWVPSLTHLAFLPHNCGAPGPGAVSATVTGTQLGSRLSSGPSAPAQVETGVAAEDSVAAFRQVDREGRGTKEVIKLRVSSLRNVSVGERMKRGKGF
ncbi:hypothetical protein SKAU_G00130360 [Synaphobranchus kaupii]|uniref:Uncharacterized protein n=1 Tax=Synaphobranchus kaupii TaxID=118154 RepID=A0A9Q1J3D8_SYNKA|nr:hypothetical protein SKAU_G00130360 [Synaphobranchus kaupii]